MPEDEVKTGDPELDKEINDTINGLGGDELDKPSDEEPPKEEPKKDEPEKKEHEDKAPKPDDKPEDKPKPEDKKPKEEAVIPAWRVKVMEKQHAKAISELNTKIAELSGQKKKGASPAEAAKTEDEIEKLTEELTAGLTDGEKAAQKTVIRRIVETARKGMQLPADVQEALKILPQLQKSHEDQQAEQQFSSEFDAEVRPLVEKEYGPVSAEILQRIKSEIKQKITSDQRLITAPLSLIYSGSAEFRGLAEAPKPKKTAEPTRPGQGRDTEVVDFENMTEEKFARLSDEDQERYTEYMREKERKNRK